MIYRFEQFKTEIIDPTVKIQSVNDSIENKTCSVEIVLTDAVGSTFGMSLTGFSYSETWEDVDVIEWVNNELKKYKI